MNAQLHIRCVFPGILDIFHSRIPGNEAYTISGNMPLGELRVTEAERLLFDTSTVWERGWVTVPGRVTAVHGFVSQVVPRVHGQAYTIRRCADDWVMAAVLPLGWQADCSSRLSRAAGLEC